MNWIIKQYIFDLLDVPSAPRPPMEVSGLTKDSFILSWTEPEKDGGSKIIDYEVHIKDALNGEWKNIGRTDANQTYIHVTKLDRKKKYWFKISARNEAGLSLPLLSDEPITLAKRISKYTQNNSISMNTFTIESIIDCVLLTNFDICYTFQHHHHHHKISISSM